MPDVKITGLTANGVALDGTELFEIVNAAGDSRKELLSDITTFVLDGAVVGVTSTGTKINGLSVTVDSKDANNPVLDLSGTLGSIDLTKQVTGALPITNGGTAATKADAAFDALAPTTTEGDIILRGASSNGRLAIGANATVLTSNGTTASWAAPAGGGLTIGTTTITSGTTTRILFDAAGILSETDGMTWNATNKALTVGGATVTTSNPVLDLTQTWNAGGVTFTGLKLNVTDTASAAASLLFDIQTGAVSQFKVSKAGAGTFKGAVWVNATTNGGIWGSGSAILVQSPLATSTEGLVMYPGGTDISRYWSNGQTFVAASLVMWSSTSSSAGASDTFIGRNAAASLRLGAANAAAPVAQTLGVQSVVAGTSNTAGANWTLAGSQGTGTGAGGSIIFQTAPAGSSGTAQNALAAVLTLDSTKQAAFTGHMQMTEITAPSAGAANTVRIYAEDNGAGKTRLMALFASGAAQQIAIEP